MIEEEDFKAVREGNMHVVPGLDSFADEKEIKPKAFLNTLDYPQFIKAFTSVIVENSAPLQSLGDALGTNLRDWKSPETATSKTLIMQQALEEQILADKIRGEPDPSFDLTQEPEFLGWTEQEFRQLANVSNRDQYDFAKARLFAGRKADAERAHLGIPWTVAGTLMGHATTPGGIMELTALGMASVPRAMLATGLVALNEYDLVQKGARSTEDALSITGISAVVNPALVVGVKMFSGGRNAVRWDDQIQGIVREHLDDIQKMRKFGETSNVNAPHDIRQTSRMFGEEDEVPFGSAGNSPASGNTPGGQPPPESVSRRPGGSQGPQGVDEIGDVGETLHSGGIVSDFLNNLPDSPIKRRLVSGSTHGARIASALTEHPFIQIKNALGIETPVGVTRKARRKWVVDGLNAERASWGDFTALRQRLGHEAAGGPARNALKDAILRPGNAAPTLDEFNEMVGRAKMILGDAQAESTFAPEVINAAKRYAAHYQKMGEAARNTQHGNMFTRPLVRERNLREAELERTLDKLKQGSDPRDIDALNARADTLRVEIANFDQRIDSFVGEALSNRFINRVYNKTALRDRKDEFIQLLTTGGKPRTRAEAEATWEALIKNKPFNAEDLPGGTTAEMLTTAQLDELDNVVSLSKSVRARMLDDISTKELADRGFIETNMAELSRHYTERTGIDIEMFDTFGSVDLAPELAKIERYYAEKISAASNFVEADKLRAARYSEIEDIKVIRDRVRKTYGIPDDPDAITSRMIRVAKMFNSMNLLTGATAAVADIANLVTRDGLGRSLGTIYDGYFKGMDRSAKVWRMSKDQAQMAGEAWDMYESLRAVLIADTADAVQNTGRFEKMMSRANQMTFNLNLMNPWNVAVKSMASLITGSRIIDEAIKFASPARNSAGAAIHYGEVIGSGGNRIAGKYNRATNTVSLDLDMLRDSFNRKSWTNSRRQLDGSISDPLPEGQFKTFKEFRDFVVEHELAHSDLPRVEADLNTGAYESRINRAALKRIGSRGAEIKGYEVSKLANAGINQQMAIRIAEQFEEHGFREGRVFLSNAAEWTDEAAKGAYLDALGKDINMMIITPGAGDLPNFMGGGLARASEKTDQARKVRGAKKKLAEAGGDPLTIAEHMKDTFMGPELAQILFQFKSFGAASQQRILVRGMQLEDGTMISNLALLTGIGAMVDSLRMYQNDINPGMKSGPQRIADAFSRGAGFSYFDAANSVYDAMTGNLRGPAGFLLGPSVQQGSNLFDLIYSAGTGDGQGVANGILRLAPLARAAHVDFVFDGLEGAIAGND